MSIRRISAFMSWLLGTLVPADNPTFSVALIASSFSGVNSAAMASGESPPFRSKWVPSSVMQETKEGPSVMLFMPCPFMGGAAQHEKGDLRKLMEKI
jgi:hypothetical protein